MRQKMKTCKIILAAIYACSIIILLYNRNLYSEMKENQTAIDAFLHYTDSEIKLLDSYDSEHTSFSDFIDTPNALEIETAAYDLLNRNKHLKYYEMYFNPIDVVGYYDKNDSAEHGFINECIGDLYYTECKGMCMDGHAADAYLLKQAVTEGRFFLPDEYNCDITKNIPVVLGASYASVFKINETFSGEYVIEQPISFVVVGFLEKDTLITVADTAYNLDDYFIFPTLSIENIKKDRDKVILLSTKLEGFVHYDTAEDYQRAADEINQIARESKFDYVHIASAKDYEDKFHISFEQCRLHYKISILVFVVCTTVFFILLLFRREKK